MSDTYEINKLGQVVPYTSGRRCNDTRAWRDATELELAQKQELEELRSDMDQAKRAIAGLRKTVVRYRRERDEAKALVPNAVEKRDAERSINVVRRELKEAGITNITEGPATVAKHIDLATREFHTVAKALGYDWLAGKIMLPEPEKQYVPGNPGCTVVFNQLNTPDQERKSPTSDGSEIK